MSKFDSHKFISNYSIYRRLLYVFLMITIVISIFSKSNSERNSYILMMIIIAFLFAADGILCKLDFLGYSSTFNAFRFIELVILSVMQGIINTSSIIIGILMVVIIFDAVEFALNDGDYDIVHLRVKKYMLFFPMVTNIIVCFINNNNEGEWFTYFVMQALSLVLIHFIIEWFIKLNKEHLSENNNLILQISNMESNNQKLMEYQERVKVVNEQINYQKIDLARTNKELEQVNVEVKSLTEVMKYMASTFDILKCINVLTDAIMEVKEPKFCAIYVDKNVYLNSLGSCIIKTNYSSMQRRLKKEIERIFLDVCNGSGVSEILYGEELSRFKFIGDANINTIAVLPFIEGSKIYGMMMVGSDDENFFKRGLGYFENSIVEFNVAVNRTKLYLKMQDMARKDGLTGIYNRVYFKELFDKAVIETKRKKKPLSVALFDIDKFKRINDTYGHIAGDRVIQMVAYNGQKYAQLYEGFACRYGGEEFLLVLPGCDVEEAVSILEALHRDIKNNIVKYEDNEIHINVCIGLTTYPTLCDDSKLLISRADKAMYYGKNNGRGRLIVDSADLDIEE